MWVIYPDEEENVHDDADLAKGHGLVGCQLRALVLVSASLEPVCSSRRDAEYGGGHAWDLSPFSARFRYLPWELQTTWRL